MNIGEQTWVSPVPYRHDKDAQALRNALAVLTTSGGLKQKALLREFDNAPGSKTKVAMSLPTFRRFIRNVGNCDKLEVLEWIWDYLHAHSKYRAYITSNQHNRESEPKRKIAAKTPKRTAEAALSDAMKFFLQREKPVTGTQFTELCKRYPGKYVMYRADLRPYLLKINAPPRFRASNLTIEHVDDCLLVTDVQDFEKTDDEAFYMKTTGILFPYGKHIMFLAQAIVRESFRLGVINREYSFSDDYKVSFFQGTILVASSEDLFPSTPFFCLRDDGTLETGLIPIERIKHKDARAHLRDAHELALLHYEKSRTVIKP